MSLDEPIAPELRVKVEQALRDAGFRYGRDAVDNVVVGWELREPELAEWRELAEGCSEGMTTLREERDRARAELGAICVLATLAPDEDGVAHYGASTEAVKGLLAERNQLHAEACTLRERVRELEAERDSLRSELSNALGGSAYWNNRFAEEHANARLATEALASERARVAELEAKVKREHEAYRAMGEEAVHWKTQYESERARREKAEARVKRLLCALEPFVHMATTGEEFRMSDLKRALAIHDEDPKP